MKEKLLHILKNETCITLQASPVHGIGVFAITTIPKGTRNLFSSGVGKWIKLRFDEVDALPKQSKALIENFCLYDETHYFVPEYGFKIMDLCVYINHSDSPNLISIDDGAFFETNRDIVAGEELFLDYGTLVDEKR